MRARPPASPPPGSLFLSPLAFCERMFVSVSMFFSSRISFYFLVVRVFFLMRVYLFVHDFLVVRVFSSHARIFFCAPYVFRCILLLGRLPISLFADCRIILHAVLKTVRYDKSDHGVRISFTRRVTVEPRLFHANLAKLAGSRFCAALGRGGLGWCEYCMRSRRW
jgi:hypothetical protein